MMFGEIFQGLLIMVGAATGVVTAIVVTIKNTKGLWLPVVRWCWAKALAGILTQVKTVEKKLETHIEDRKAHNGGE